MDDDWGRRSRRWVGIRTEWVDVQATRVRTLRADGPGAGLPQLLVHGLGGAATNWLEVMTELAQLGPVVAPDLPGFGHTEPPSPRAARVRAQARFLPALCRRLGYDRVIVHGNSMGGLIAVLVAAHDPQLVHRLVLVDAALPTPAAKAHQVTPRTLARFLPFAVPGLGRRILARMWDRYTPEQMWADSRGYIYGDPERVAPELTDIGIANIAHGQQAAWRRPSFAVAAESLVGAVVTPRRLLKDVDRVTAPTLMLWGDADQLVSRAAVELIETRRPDWEVQVLTGVGHCPQLETPDDYLAVVSGWLARTESTAQSA